MCRDACLAPLTLTTVRKWTRADDANYGGESVH